MFIFKDKFYFVVNDYYENHKLQTSVTPNFVKVDRGLLIQTSLINFSVMNFLASGKPDNRAADFRREDNKSTFMVFSRYLDKEGNQDYVTIYEYHDSWVRRIARRENFADIGVLGSLANENGTTFMKACFLEGIPMDRAYRSFANIMGIGARTPEFIKNSKGIPLDDLFGHPYALTDLRPPIL